MQTYKLINNKTKEETICSLVTIDGFDYYISDTKNPTIDGELYHCGNKGKGIDVGNGIPEQVLTISKYTKDRNLCKDCKLVIATNNLNLDIPKVIDEVDNIIKNAFYDKKGDFKRSTIGADDWINGLKLGYNKAKETYQFTEEDIFGLKDLLQNTSPLMFEVVTRNYIRNLKETKTIYYE